jgi:hypothetical protein
MRTSDKVRLRLLDARLRGHDNETPKDFLNAHAA